MSKLLLLLAFVVLISGKNIKNQFDRSQYDFDDDEKSLEEEQSDQYENEPPAAFEEESDNNLEEEDEDEARVSKVQSDIQHVRSQLSELSSKNRQIAAKDLDAISRDVTRFAKGEHTAQLKRAIKNRIQALKLLAEPLHDQEEERDSDIDDEDVVEDQAFEEDAEAKVENDVKRVRAAVQSSSLSKKEKQNAIQNLQKLEEDAQRYTSASDASKKLLKQAMKLRLEELKSSFGRGAESNDLEEESDVEAPVVSKASNINSKIERDVENVQRALEGEHVSKAVKDNLAAITHDAEELHSAHGVRHEQLVRAMKLRTQALKQQLHKKH